MTKHFPTILLILVCKNPFFSLKVVKSVGNLRGKVNHKAQVETLGSTVSPENSIEGEASVKPSEGVSIPVRNTITSQIW